MAFWNRRGQKVVSDDLGNVVTAAAVPSGAKSLVITDDAWQTVRDYGWPLADHYGLIYRRQPAVRTVVDFLARNIGQLRLKTYARLDNNDRQELDDHPLAVLLRKPNPTTTGYRHMRDTVADIGIYDRAYWRKFFAGSTRAVVRIPPPLIVRTSEGQRLVYRDTEGNIIPRDQLVVFPGYNPTGDWNNEDGVSALETLRITLQEEWDAQQSRRNSWRNSARQAGVIERPLEAPDWSSEARQRFRHDWEATMSGAGNAGRTGILEEGMTWNAASFSPKDMLYIEGRNLTFNEVCRQYGMSPQLFTGDSANANIESFHRQLYQDTFGPWLRMIQDEIELQLLPDLEAMDLEARATAGRVYCEFNLSEKLKGSFEELARTLTTSAGVPTVAVNEARAKLNLPRIDDEVFDVPVQPLNVMYGGQPAVTVPTDVPQSGHGEQRALPSGRKADLPAGALRRRNQAAAQHAAIFRKYFRDLEEAVRKFAKSLDGWDMARWDDKLMRPLWQARSALARETGRRAARQLGGVYDPALTDRFLEETSRATAENINRHVLDLASAASDDAGIVAVFAALKDSGAQKYGLSTATGTINFARHEAAVQSQRADNVRRTKTWIVTSSKSRHPEMGGETVNIDEDFSNGLPWPGAAVGTPDEIAGCQCLLEMS